jgi:hypothetical protein
MSEERNWHLLRLMSKVFHHVEAAMGELSRAERLQVMLSPGELKLIDNWRFTKRMPSRASAVRELLKRGLLAEGFETAEHGSRSKDFGLGSIAAE